MHPSPSFAKPFNSSEELQALAAELNQDDEEPLAPPDQAPAADGYNYDWEPPLNPTQKRIYDDHTATFILAYGELASGKTIAVLHKLVDHCFEEWNALAMIVVEVKSVAEEGGAWHKLKTIVLPEWAEGRRIRYTDEKSNAQKNVYLWISNRHGGWSRVTLISMPVESLVKSRAKGQEPSFIFVDEAQTLKSRTYFTSLSQRLMRRPGIKDEAYHLVYGANPAGPSHWLYQLFFIDPVDPKTQKWNKQYAKYHVPVKENRHNLKPGYYDLVMESVRGDPIEEARMIRGEWVDRPTGEAMFLGFFVAARHVRPVEGLLPRTGARTVMGLLPLAGFPISIGYDLGAAHTAIFFEQLLVLPQKNVWLIFDELDFVGQYMAYSVMVPDKILPRMRYWDKRFGKPFEWEHISDNSAFNQFRASDGSYDVLDVEKHSNGKIRLRACPKPPNSVAARVTMLRGKCTRDEILVSAACPNAIGMFNHLESEKADPLKAYDPFVGLKPKRSPWIHRFDALTYPMFFYDLGGIYRPPDSERAKPEVFQVGAGKAA